MPVLSTNTHHDSSCILDFFLQPIFHIPNYHRPQMAGHPNNAIFLSCDAFGVLPPIALLEPEQAMYHFMSGYTAKVAGTERGIKEPSATFSTCFGAAFMTLHPTRYAELLKEKMEKHGIKQKKIGV